MREVKFRFWDKEKKRFIHNILMDKNGNIYTYNPCTEILNDEIKINYVICEYTGIKDKNGKEIFEGDVLSDGVENYIVKIGIYCIDFEYTGYEELAGVYLNCITTKNVGDVRFDCSSSFWEVIGNIYENPNLIE